MWRVLSFAAVIGCGRLRFDASPDASRLSRDAFVPDAGIPGLVAWFPLDDPDMTFADALGGPAGTCGTPNCPVPTPGHRGQGLLFDGVDDCIAVPDVGQFSSAQITISIWARPDVSSPTAIAEVSKRVDYMAHVDNTWELESYDTGQLAFTSDHSTVTNEQILSAPGTVAIGVWHHMAATYDGATNRLYLDGVLASSSAQPSPLAYDSHGAMIGCDDNVGISEAFSGALDELQIYDRALDDGELAELAAE